MFDSIVHSKLYSSLYIHCFTVNLYTNSQYSNNPPPHPFIPCIHYVPFPLNPTWHKLYPHPFIPCIHYIIPASYLAYTIPPLYTLHTLYHSRFIPCKHYTIPASYLAYIIPPPPSYLAFIIPPFIPFIYYTTPHSERVVSGLIHTKKNTDRVVSGLIHTKEYRGSCIYLD